MDNKLFQIYVQNKVNFSSTREDGNHSTNQTVHTPARRSVGYVNLYS